MLRIAVLIAALAPIAPVPPGATADAPDQLSRVDPGKTLQLIKRIRAAGEGHVASQTTPGRPCVTCPSLALKAAV